MPITRRSLIAGTASLAAAVASRPALLYAQAAPRPSPTPTPPAPFKLDPLLYPTSALAPNIDICSIDRSDFGFAQHANDALSSFNRIKQQRVGAD